MKHHPKTIKREINQLESRIVSLKDSGFTISKNKKGLEDYKNKLKVVKQKLRNLISNSQKQRKRHAVKKQMIAELADKSPVNSAKLRKFVNKLQGRQPHENLYPDLRLDIIDLATVGAGSDSRRQTDVLNSCKTLDDLHATLRKEGYILRIRALYFRLIPRSADSQEGKRHVRTVPVKLRKAKNTLRNRHADADFTFAINRQCVISYLSLDLIMSLFCQ